MKFLRRNLKLILIVILTGLTLMGISASLNALHVLSTESAVYVGLWDLGVILFALPFCFLIAISVFYVRDLIYIRLTGKNYIDFNIDIAGKILSPPENNKKK